MGFVQLGAQAKTSKEGVANKIKELIERVAAFCQSVGGKADVSEDRDFHHVECKLPSRDHITVSAGSNPYTVEIEVGWQKLTLNDVPDIIGLTIGLAQCGATISKGRSGARCYTKADRFRVSIGKKYEDIRIYVPEPK